MKYKKRLRIKEVTKRVVSLASVLALTAVALVGCGNTKKDNDSASLVEEQQTRDYTGVTIRVGAGNDVVKYDLAQALGYWEEEFGADGIKVEVVRLNNGADFVDGVSTGSVDIGIYGDQPIIAAITGGKKLQIIGRSGDDSAGYKIVTSQNSGINSLSDLKGKKVGITLGTNGHKVLIQSLKSVGLTLDDVEVVNLSSANSIAALKNGKIDATAGYTGTGADLGSFKVIKEYKDVARSIHVIAAGTDFLSEYPELAARVLKVIQKTGLWINNNRSEAIKKIVEIGGYTEAQATAIYDAEVWNVQWDAKDAEVIEYTSQWLYESDVLKKQLKAKDMVSTKYLKLAGFTVGSDINY